MAKIALKLDKKDREQRKQLCQTLETNLTGNAHVPTPNPSIAALTAKREAILAQEAVVAAAKTDYDNALIALDVLDQQLLEMLRQEGETIQSATNGDKAKIISTGAEVQGDATPAQQLGPVQNLRVTGGDLEGELDGQGDPLQGRDFYEVEIADAPGGLWRQVYSGKKSSFTITGLVSGQNYFLRMRGKNSVGPGTWSDIAQKRAT